MFRSRELLPLRGGPPYLGTRTVSCHVLLGRAVHGGLGGRHGMASGHQASLDAKPELWRLCHAGPRYPARGWLESGFRLIKHGSIGTHRLGRNHLNQKGSESCSKRFY